MAACIAVAAAVLLGTGTVLTLGALHHKGPAAASAATLGPGGVTQAPLSANSHQGVLPSPSRSGSTKRHIGLTITVSGSPPATTPSLQGPHPGSPPPSHPHPSPSPSGSPPPSPGTLTVSTNSVTLSSSGGPYTGSFSITAQGGAVSYSIADPAPPGDLAVSPSSGSLSAGQSITVTVTVVSAVGLASETDLTVNPGGLLVAVFYPPG